ncbi:ATP-binding protein [Actinomadura fibrosa]|uniref:ATP-binding protein n=1 Tax=Actinomadura fibrosa TaxID=111802 RepID=A0ABW2XTH7_9ACTN
MATITDDLVISLLGSPASVGLARTLTGARLHKWGYSHLHDDALTIVTELVTNAISETPDEKVRLQVSRDVQGVIIAVWDASPRLPQPKPVVELTLDDLDLSEDAFDDNGGWGLSIVSTLASTCGATRDTVGGKWIWARMVP